MNSGGITKRTFCVWAAVAAFIVAMLCAIESSTGGSAEYRGLAVCSFVLGLIFFAGVFVNSFQQNADPDKDQW